MTQNTTRLDMSLNQPAQAQKHVTHNEALQVLDVVTQLSVISASETAPLPKGISMGLVPVRQEIGQGRSAILFIVPTVAGCSSHLRTGGGLGTTYDDQGRLAVFSLTAVFTHTTTDGDHRLQVNKKTSKDVTSLVFQTGWSGTAEIGIVGFDDFSIKVSDDGTNFI